MFKDRLKSTRKALGLTQAEFGKMGGVGLTAQSLYEKGERAPTINYLEALQLHGIDVAYLVSERYAETAHSLSDAQIRQISERLFEWLDNGNKKYSVSERGALLGAICREVRKDPTKIEEAVKDAIVVFGSVRQGG